MSFCVCKPTLFPTQFVASRYVLMCSAALLPLLASAATAQELELEGIVIHSANRTLTDGAKVGSSVSVVTKKDLESQSGTYLKDYLAQVPGISFDQSGSPGATAGISLRGASNRYVKVLVDGMDISDPSSTQTSTHFEHLLVGDVSRIEVLKGSQSTLYGGDAVAGVISVETRAALTPGFSQSAFSEYGTYNTYRGGYTAGYAADDGSNVSFTVQGINSDGFSAAAAGSEDDGYRNLTLSGRGEYVVSPSMKIFFAARSVDADFDFDGFPPPLFALADTPEHGTMLQHAGRVGTEFSFFGGAFQNTLAIQGMTVERENFLNGASTAQYDGDRVKGEYKGFLTFNESLSLLAGADWERTGASSNLNPSRETADLAGAYAQLMLEPVDGLMLTGGGRIDDHSTFGSFNTYRLTAAYLVPGTETKLHASLGTGFRAPSLYEIFDPTYGNTDLLPEESKSWDVGIEQGFLEQRYKIGVTYFELDTDNLIDWSPAGYYNVPGATHRKGVELSAGAMITEGLTLTAGYAYVDAEQADGNRLVRVPRHTVMFGIDAQPMDKLELNVTARLVADTIDSRFPGFVTLDDYVLVNAKASYEFAPGWKAYVRGENLLDEDYQTVVDYGTAGLTVFGGIQMALSHD